MTAPNLLTPASPAPEPDQVLLLDPAVCHPAPGNRLVTVDMVSDLLRSMEATGQLVPGFVYPDPERPGHWFVADGNHRVLCCRVLGRKFRGIPLDHAPTPAELRRLRFTTNSISKHATQDEKAADVVAHMEETGCSYREAAEFFGIDASYAWKLAAETRLLPELAHLKQNPNVCRDVRRIIATMPNDDLQRRLADKVQAQLAAQKPVKRDLVTRWAKDLKLTAGFGKSTPRETSFTHKGITVTFTAADPGLLTVPFAEIHAAVKKLAADKRPAADLPDYLKGA